MFNFAFMLKKVAYDLPTFGETLVCSGNTPTAGTDSHPITRAMEKNGKLSLIHHKINSDLWFLSF